MSSSDDDNPFAALMSSSDYEGGEEDDEGEEKKEIYIPPAPVIQNTPPPPPSKPKQDEPKEKDIDAEFMELMQQQKKRETHNAPKREINDRLKFNVAQELIDRYDEQAFADAAKIPKSAPYNKFINRRREWPSVVSSSYRVRELPGDKFEVTFTEYGLSCKKQFAKLEELRVQGSIIQDALQILPIEPFCPQLLYPACNVALFQREFNVATDLALRLTWILQQTLPTNFKPTKTIFVGEAAGAFQNLAAYIATFCFRRGCYNTSAALWKFCMENFMDDQCAAGIAAAVPNLFAGDINFIERVYKSNRKVFNVPIQLIPDWSVCLSLLEKSDDRLKENLSIWRHCLLGEDLPENTPDKLGSVEMLLKKRLDPYLKRDEVAERINKLSKEVEKGDRQKLVLGYAAFQGDIPVFQILEEAAMPVGS
ncbi:hypothetical protein TVAG_061860 [Trichomonas vaginalis G3]|uniref:Uncharacterized protein n=1 Tax=Trichomonas vaginalis (strain ATCC PRA-98 / G3) TaxID=412133 RepID=A2E7V1_TRIV3|nr:hypothetical protein TVAGG3_0282650 [Trichomonas vaginalis G3]EAY11282.1 hypothetical protein TVAG_061860 [Trichomonas vaginalis G3]KAI5526676.1 hypothetical protein TVAGG3_0282650 [Trichomonas vaginalis G3]|eukprot:XP_001323505.1 hypothetical protein [Trichomonas vaginalis G3]